MSISNTRLSSRAQLMRAEGEWGSGVHIIGGVIDGDWPARGDLGTQLGIRREHTHEIL